MKVQSVTSQSSDYKQNNKQVNITPSFKAGGLGTTLGSLGFIMQKIEDGGFLASFLIQDTIGMTAPRASAAFLRDKEVTGEYNIQEGFEVLGREGLTGPCMMAVAPIMFALCAKFGRSTGINSQLIKRFGDSLKNIVTDSNFDKSLLKEKDKFKQEFYKVNIKEMLTNTLGEKNVSDDAVNHIMGLLAKYENVPRDANLPKNILGLRDKGKYKKQKLAEITDYINDKKYKTTDDLSSLNRINVCDKTFGIDEALISMIKYSDDAIRLNKNLSNLDEVKAENIKNSALTKRLFTNIATMFTTLGVLSVLPKLYIKSDISPGARTAQQLREKNLTLESDISQDENVKIDENKNINFKSKNPNKSLLAKIGESISGIVDKDFFAKELEYKGHNFTNTLMEVLSIFGLLAPRGVKAYQRAQVDDTGRKDLTELYEIFIRDLTSSLAVVFAVPMLTRATISVYENKSGFVLLQKDRTMSKKSRFLDLINPYSKTHVLTNSEIKALYNGVDSSEKMMNFCRYIDKNGGDLAKILSKSDFAEEFFKNTDLKLEELEKLNKKEKNAKIISFFDKFANDSKLEKQSINDSITKLMKGNALAKKNKILSFARGLNSLPGIIATFCISPYILGWVIPQLTYANTRRIHEKAEKRRLAEGAKIDKAV